MSVGPILCAIDISNDHKDVPVLKRAIQLAKMDDVMVDLITVVPDFGNSWVSSYFAADHHKQAMEEAKAHLVSIGDEIAGPDEQSRLRHRVVTGSAYEGILKMADAQGSSTIVIGSHKPELSDYLLGPNAARVVRHSKCSVLVVR